VLALVEIVDSELFGQLMMSSQLGSQVPAAVRCAASCEPASCELTPAAKNTASLS